MEDVATFQDAVRSGQKMEWIEQNFSSQYPRDLPDEAIIHDLLMSLLLGKYSITLYQCEVCGRLWIQEPHGTEKFRSFMPEGIWEGTLAVPEESRSDDNQPSST
jgi:hypothetical protein